MHTYIQENEHHLVVVVSWSSRVRECRCAVSYGSGYFGNYWSNSFDGDCTGFPGHYSVKTIVCVSGVVNHSFGTVSFNEGVTSLDGISVTGFLLALAVAGVRVVNGVSEFVVGGSGRLCDDSFGVRGGYFKGWGGVGQRCSGVRQSWGSMRARDARVRDGWSGRVCGGGHAEDSSTGDGYKGGENYELQENN